MLVYRVILQTKAGQMNKRLIQLAVESSGDAPTRGANASTLAFALRQDFDIYSLHVTYLRESENCSNLPAMP